MSKRKVLRVAKWGLAAGALGALLLLVWGRYPAPVQPATEHESGSLRLDEHRGAPDDQMKGNDRVGQDKDGRQPPAWASGPARHADRSRPARPETLGEKPEPLGARTPEDASWLTSRGYPTQLDKDEARSLPFDPEAGPPTDSRGLAMAEAALRNRTYRESAESALLGALDSGATYSLLALGQFYETRSPVKAHAYYRAAAALGDWHAALRQPVPIGGSADALATALSIKIVHDMQENRARRGLPPFVAEARPGLEDVVLAMAVAYEEETGQRIW